MMFVNTEQKIAKFAEQVLNKYDCLQQGTNVPKFSADICWYFEVWAMQNYFNPVDPEKQWKNE